MRLQRWSKERPVLIGGSAALVLAASLLLVWWESRGPEYRPASNVWFYDLASEPRLFSVPAGTLPPVEAHSKKLAPGPGPVGGGPAGVRAWVYACGGCDRPDARFVAYLETYTPEAKAALLGATGPGGTIEDITPAQRHELDDVLAKGHRVATPEALDWVPRASPEGQKLVASPATHCREGEVPVECGP